MSKLKRCPFCGGEARVNIFLGNYCVTCENCMGAIFPARGMTEEEAIKAWNTRKPIERIVERLEGIEESLFLARDSIGNEIYKDVEAHQKAQRLLNQELSFTKAIEILKEEGGMNG